MSIKGRYTIRTVFLSLLLVFNFLPNYSQAQVEKINCEILSRDFADVDKFPVAHTSPFYSEGDDLSPLGRVFDILVDKSGYTWFGTSAGVRRYNGYDFTDFDIQNGLTDPIVIHLYEDYAERIWFVSLFGLIHCYENGVLHAYEYNDIVSPYLTGDKITSFYIDSSETLHIGTYTKGYLQISKEGELKKIISPESDHEGIGIVLLDDSIPFFFQTPCEEKDRVTFYDPDFNIIREFSLFGAPGCEKHYTQTIRLLQLADQSFLLSYENVLTKFSINGEIERYYYSGNIIAIFEDSNGSIWVSVNATQVLFYPQGIDKKTAPISYFTEQRISSIKEDHQHGIWIGTVHSSAYYIPVSFISYSYMRDMFDYQAYTVDFVTHSSSTKNNFQLISRKGHLFFSKGTTLNCIDLNISMNTEDMVFNGLYARANDNFIIGSKNDLYRISGDTLNAIPKASTGNINRLPSAILVSSVDSSMWFNSGSRLIKSLNGEVTFYSDTIGSEIQSMMESENGALWIAAINGLWKYENDSLIHLGESDSLLRHPILAMAEFGGSVWIQCKNYDLLRKRFNQKAEVFTYEGRSFPNPAAFFAKKDELFFISDYYLTKISNSPAKPDSFDVRSIRLSKKISSKNGGLYLGEWLGKLTFISASEVFQFHFLPDPEDQPAPSLHIDQLKINNRDTTILSKYDLSHTENHISIGFITVSNTEARATKYKYRIKGIDPEWIETSDRKVQYTSLPTGTHTFEVYTKPKLETWSKKPVTISFTINPPYWETWWFMSLSILAFSALSIGAAVYRFKRLRHENQLQMALNESQQQALSARMNPHFIFNALNSIKTYVLENDVVQSNDYIARFSKLMRQILDQSQYTLIPLEDELKALDNYVSLELMRGKDRFGYSISVDPNIDQKLAKVPSLLLQPFVENAIWHGVMPLNRPGHVSVSLHQKANEILCTIEDDGVGRTKTNSEGHIPTATQISNKRLDLINKRFRTRIHVQIEDILDQQGAVLGTKVIIPIPTEFKN